MISMARVDDRLIHGQVAVMWSKQLGISRIIVASDQISANEIQKNALIMAAPDSVKAFILPLDKAADLLKDPRSEKMKILLLSNNPLDILNVLKKVGGKASVDIANFGRIGGKLSDKEKITETVYVTPEEKAAIKEMINLGHDVFYQPLPNDPKIEFIKLLGGK